MSSGESGSGSSGSSGSLESLGSLECFWWGDRCDCVLEDLAFFKAALLFAEDGVRGGVRDSEEVEWGETRL